MNIEAMSTEITSLSRNKCNLTLQQRISIYHTLLEGSINGKLPKGILQETAARFSVSRLTISRIWHRGRNSIREGKICADVSSRKLGNSGPKYRERDLSRMKQIPLRLRKNLRTLAVQLDIPKSTLHDSMKRGAIKVVSSAIKPYLTEENKLDRLRYCIIMINTNSQPGNLRYGNMNEYVHVDEKWFFMTEVDARFYLHPEEELPHRTCKSKRFIAKVMFLTAVARPRWDTSRNQWFDGKIGIWPFVEDVPAKRNSKNRGKGTLEKKPINVDSIVYRDYMMNKVLPAIRQKWPRGRVCKIQQDNATPHIRSDDKHFLEEASKTGLDISFSPQPANSPDLNVLDLGFFRSIQSLQHQKSPKTIPELIKAVEESFNDLDSEKLNKVFLSLQQCMTEVMKVKGCNRYKLPHMGKDKLERQGALPETLPVDFNLVQETMNALQLND